MNAADQELVALIRKAVPPLSAPRSAIDLWPRLEHRLNERRTSPGRLDWLMAALVLGLLAAFPEAALLVLYHL